MNELQVLSPQTSSCHGALGVTWIGCTGSKCVSVSGEASSHGYQETQGALGNPSQIRVCLLLKNNTQSYWCDLHTSLWRKLQRILKIISHPGHWTLKFLDQSRKNYIRNSLLKFCLGFFRPVPAYLRAVVSLKTKQKWNSISSAHKLYSSSSSQLGLFFIYGFI